MLPDKYNLAFSDPFPLILRKVRPPKPKEAADYEWESMIEELFQQRQKVPARKDTVAEEILRQRRTVHPHWRHSYEKPLYIGDYWASVKLNPTKPEWKKHWDGAKWSASWMPRAQENYGAPSLYEELARKRTSSTQHVRWLDNPNIG